MAKLRRLKKAWADKTLLPKSNKSPRIVFISIAAGVALMVALAAGATSEFLNGHLTVTQDAPQSPELDLDSDNNDARRTVPAESACAPFLASPKTASDLVDSYGTAAQSPTVAAAIRNAESKTLATPKAKEAADRLEALEHGHPLPGTDPMQLIMHGYVPPGMPPQQVAMLYRNLPHLPNVSGPMTPERIARAAGEPIDPQDALLQAQGLSRDQIEAANSKMFEDYTREKFGPIYVPPLHRDHNWLAQHAQKNAGSFIVLRDNQMSLIQAQYAYDPPRSVREMTDSSGNIVRQYGYDPWGRVTVLQGSGPDSDFGYGSMYVHQRSGLNLAVHRAYSPALGRWISRDPINDLTFKLIPRSPEPRTPNLESAIQFTSRRIALIPNPTHDAVVGAQLARIFRAPFTGTHRPNNLNPYVYVANNPVLWRDPSGLMIGSPPSPQPPHCPIHPPPPGEEGAPPDLYDCYKWCSEHNMTLEDYLDCTSWCDEHYLPDPG